jgi:type VI secretion system VasD/TssJ family lipoprotein
MSSPMRRWGRASFIVFLLMSACAHQPPPPCPEQDLLRVRIAAPPNANDGLPSLVRVYLLKTERAFLDASFADLLRGDASAFKDDQIEAREVVVPPGGNEKVLEFARTADRGERFVAVFVGFGSQNGKWRLTAPVPAKDAAFCHEKARELHLRLDTQDAYLTEHPASSK